MLGISTKFQGRKVSMFQGENQLADFETLKPVKL